MRFTRTLAFKSVLAVTLVASGFAGGQVALADDDDGHLQPGNLLVSRVVYDNIPSNLVKGVTVLPPNCTGAPPACVKANADGLYPFVFDNALIDGSFGITSKIVLDQITPFGSWINSIEVPNSSQRGVSPNTDQMVSSFSSKSEVALNLSTDRQSVAFMGYLSPVDALDVSNSNTPGVVDPTNPVTESVFRVVAELDRQGHLHFTKTNAYSGNNGRAAILNTESNPHSLYMIGNAGNGSNPQPAGVITGAGAQIATALSTPEVSQDPGQPTPVGSFNITQLPANTKTDKIGKDTNFRGLKIFDNVIYTTKGSGGNGINTVYFIDTSGFNGNVTKACPNGVGVPSAGAALPVAPINFSAANLPTLGVFPYNMCILNGFPTTLAKSPSETAFPFGVWFANANTVYVTDEGNGTTTFDAPSNTFTVAAGQTTAGLQKWTFDGTTWHLAYVLQRGLDLGVPYTVNGYPTGTNTATGLPWSPATDGLRNLTGRVNRDGTVTIWAITSTVSGSGDQGADPNKLLAITDSLAATSLPAGESFTTVKTARFAEVLRGVSLTPGSNERCAGDGRSHDDSSCDDDGHHDDDGRH